MRVLSRVPDFAARTHLSSDCVSCARGALLDTDKYHLVDSRQLEMCTIDILFQL